MEASREEQEGNARYDRCRPKPAGSWALGATPHRRAVTAAPRRVLL